MNYSLPLSQQIVVFVKAAGSGIVIGIIYDLIYTLRVLISEKRKWIVFQDVLFGVIATMVSFFFMVIFNSGIVRFNLVAAQAVGAAAFHFTVGRTLSETAISIGDTIKKLLSKGFYPLIFLKKKAELLAGTILLKIRQKIAVIKKDGFKRKEKCTEDTEHSKK